MQSGARTGSVPSLSDRGRDAPQADSGRGFTRRLETRGSDPAPLSTSEYFADNAGSGSDPAFVVKLPESQPRLGVRKARLDGRSRNLNLGPFRLPVCRVRTEGRRYRSGRSSALKAS